MKINFKEMASRTEPLQFATRLDTGRLIGQRRDVLQHTPVQAELEAMMMAGIVRVDGQMDSDIVFSCSRCLTEVEEHITVPFHESFSQDERYKDEDEHDDVVYIPQDTFELEPYLEAEFLLAMPFVTLCDEACKGLCPVCGINRNEADCTCNTERIDPRLADLQKFFDRS